VSRGSFEYDETKGDDEQEKITNWVRFWQQQTHVDLGNIASVLLSMGVSETACERSFSLQQLTHSKIRNRLTPQIVEAEMI